MNFNSNTCHTSSSGNSTTAVADVAAHVPTVLKYSSGTRFEDYSSVHTWTVKRLTSWREGIASTESAPLTHQNSSKWCMVLTKKENELHLCFLLKQGAANKHLRAKLKADEILPSGSIREVYPSKWYNLKEGEKSESRLIKKVGSDGENNDVDEITLQCEVCMQCVIRDELPVADITESQAGVMRAVDEMLQKEVHTDFELHVEGAVLKAHKAVLSVQSPYFAAMLQPHTKEMKEGRVEIKGVTLEVLKQVLLYMYTGVAPALRDIPLDLLIAADKFQLLQLKRECEVHLASSLSVENAAETAANASLFSCDLLWDRAVVFIKHNLVQVMRTAGWAEALVVHPNAIKSICGMME